MSSEDKQHQTNPFDAAKSITNALKGLEKSDQERALRWAAESLGIHLSGMSNRSVAQPTAPVMQAHGETSPQNLASAQSKDIKTFVEEKRPKSDNQYSTVVAYYYRFEAPEDQRRETIDGDTLQESTRLSGWKRLTSPSVTLNKALQQGYLDRSERGQFKINTVGENLVAMTLPGSGNESASAPRNRKSRKKPAKKVSKNGPKRGKK
ncbi:MAG TPA: hypothetical protein VM658_09875 [bacterium]|nr:hypothetical protein [bacterium]